MRILQCSVVIGSMAFAAVTPAQESLCNPCLDVPADYEAIKPLPTEWPRPAGAISPMATRYNMRPSGPIDSRQLLELRSYMNRLSEKLGDRVPGAMLPRRLPPAPAEPAVVEPATPPEPDPAPAAPQPDATEENVP